MPSLNQISDSVLDLGRLIGLLKNNDTVNIGWFNTPVDSLETINTRLALLVATFYDVLDSPITDSPIIDTYWLQIKDPLNTSDKLPYYIVLPKQGAAAGTIGMGTILPYTPNNVTVDVYVFIPLFNYDDAGAQFLLSQPFAGIQLGLSVARNDGTSFSVAGETNTLTFASIQIASCICLGASTPTMSLQFQSLTGTTAPDNYDTIAALMGSTDALNCINFLLQDSTAASWLRLAIGTSTLTTGQLLNDTGFIAPVAAANPITYTLSLDRLQDTDPTTIAVDFLRNLILTVLNNTTNQVLVNLPDNGSISFYKSLIPADNSATFGLQLEMAIPLNTDVTGTQPVVSLCLGSWLENETDNANWMTRTMPTGLPLPLDGITVSLLNLSADNNYTLSPGFGLSSIGFDVIGNPQNPLVNLDGYTLQEAQLRSSLNPVDVDDPATWTYGFAAKLEEFGFPLVPAMEGNVGDGSNPVAQNLLQSGNTNSGSGANPGDQTPVNPTFSISTSWYLGGSFDVKLYDQNNNAANQINIPVNRKLGPIACSSLGIGWIAGDNKLSLLFDGGISVGPLSIELDDLSINIPATTPTDLGNYSIDLDGMGVSFTEGSINIDAALVKVPSSPTHTYTEYDGTAAVETGTFSISALGSYAYVDSNQDGYASLFIFGTALAPLGGPACFYVTGLAGGFGYNRALVLPTPDKVSSFPLVAALSNPAKLGAAKDSTSGAWTFPGPNTVLATMDASIPPQRGEYWLAAGVRFTSYDFLHTSALLNIEFGKELEIGVLGDSWMSVPLASPNASAPPDSTLFSYAELGIDIQILPSRGVIKATAILSNNSYVLDPSCKLTGGFAFYSWFGNNPHAGEFVLTLGGYSPSFKPPSYFPKVPRLGYKWRVEKDVTISGKYYYAITSSCIMAGGGLNIVFSSGGLKAWFTAQMDVLVNWSPFYYVADVSVSVGVSYRIHVLFVSVTLKVELDATLHLWGPRMGGKVHIDWHIISFTIRFGSSQASASNKPIPWTASNGQGFLQTLVPQSNNTNGGNPASASNSSPSILSITALSGVNSTITDTSGNCIWVVSPADFSFSTLSIIPLTAVDITPASGEAAPTQWLANTICSDGADYFVGIRPMAATLNASVLNVTLTDDDAQEVYDLAASFDLTPSIVNTPAAKWGKPLANGANPEKNAVLNGRLFGFQTIQPKLTALSPLGNNALSIDIAAAYTVDIVDQPTNYLPLSPSAQAPDPVPIVAQNACITYIKPNLNSSVRTDIYNILVQDFGYNPQTNDDLTNFADNPGMWINGNPLILSSYPAN